MIVAERPSLGVASPNEECIKNLWRQANRYHYASKQDVNPAVVARHNGYAVALLSALRDISDETEVKRITGGSLKAIWKDALDVQDKVEGVALKLLEDLKKKGIKIPGIDLNLGNLGGAETARRLVAGQNPGDPAKVIGAIVGLGVGALLAYALFRAMTREKTTGWKIVYGVGGTLEVVGASAMILDLIGR